jgi:hypothetical protein
VPKADISSTVTERAETLLAAIAALVTGSPRRLQPGNAADKDLLHSAGGTALEGRWTPAGSLSTAMTGRWSLARRAAALRCTSRVSTGAPRE